MTTDDRLVSGATSEPSLHPNKSSGNIVERLARPIDAWVDSRPTNPLNVDAMNNWLCAQCVLAAAEIERLRRELAQQEAETEHFGRLAFADLGAGAFRKN